MENEVDKKIDLRSATPETWDCIDCGINTHPGSLTREQMEEAYALAEATHSKTIAEITYDENCEVYTVKNTVWKAAGMGGFDGCLCIGCLEKRIGRLLTPRDFPRDDPFNSLPGTDRLLSRREMPLNRQQRRAQAAMERKWGAAA
jgi:hypothetical protein